MTVSPRAIQMFPAEAFPASVSSKSSVPISEPFWRMRNFPLSGTNAGTESAAVAPPTKSLCGAAAASSAASVRPIAKARRLGTVFVFSLVKLVAFLLVEICSVLTRLVWLAGDFVLPLVKVLSRAGGSQGSLPLAGLARRARLAFVKLLTAGPAAKKILERHR